MSSTHDSTHLVEQANASAKRMALCWIRSVFRQVSVQTLWTIERHDSTKLLHITHEHLRACERTCERLGTFWCRRLRDSGQAQVAEWVQQVMEQKRFWESDDAVREDQEAQDIGTTETTETASATRLSEEKAADQDKDKVEPLPLPSNGNKLILTRIRKMGERTIGEGPPSFDRVSRTLDELGRRGETEWPYDWSIVEEAARQNVKRLHSETIKGRPLQKVSNDNYEVVPKSLVEREATSTTENQQEIDVIMASRGRLTMRAIERKRKAAAEPTTAENQVARAASPPLSLETIARRPSCIGDNEHWSWQEDVVAALSEQDRQTLERDMIHAPAANESAAEFHSVLGALKDVGGYHFYLQNQQQHENVEEMSDKKMRREERKARKQRLFPHEPEKEDREAKRAVTKVVRTIDGTEQQHWMELDLGECIMEVVDPDSNQKKLCTFSSLEVMVKDEDAASDTAEESQQSS